MLFSFLKKLLDNASENEERLRLKRSYEMPFFVGIGRDTFAYYENGRSIKIFVERKKTDGELFYESTPHSMHWRDTGEAVSLPKEADVAERFCAYFRATGGRDQRDSGMVV